MHRCLRVEELLRIILVEIPIKNRALLSMALTCKTFLEPALDAIWRVSPGLRYLLACLPEDALEIDWHGGPEKHSGGTGVLDIIRIPRREEWSRVQYYARRVRETWLPFRTDIEPRFLVSVNCFEIIKGHYPEPFLLPNLRTFECGDTGITDHYRLFVPPRLEKAVFDWPASEAVFFLEALASKPCKLRILDIGSEDPDEELDDQDFVDQLGRVVLQHTLLEHVRVPGRTSEEALVHLSRSNHLHTLEATFSNKGYKGVLNASPSNFPRLTKLRLRRGSATAHVACLTHFLHTFARYSILEHLRLDFTFTSASDPQLDRFFHVIAQFSALKMCKLIYQSNWSRRWQGDPLNATVLQPLYRTASMRVFNLASIPVSVSPDDIRQMADAWPSIAKLFLGSRHPGSPALVALEDLAPLAEKCPQLSQLGITLRSSTNAGWEPPLATGRRKITRQQIDVGASNLRIEDAPHLANVLHTLCPTGELLLNSSNARLNPGARSTIGEVHKLLNISSDQSVVDFDYDSFDEFD